MTEIFGVPLQLVAGQLLLGLINGGFYALLSLGLAVIFGMLNIVNFAQGALFMVGAFVALVLQRHFGVSYWWALLIAPIVIGALGLVIERGLMRRLYKLDHIYGLLLTLGLAMVIEGLFRNLFGTAGQFYGIPKALQGVIDLKVLLIPKYRLWVVFISAVVCLATWLIIEKTRLGARLRAATENPGMVQAFGINVPLMICLTYGAGVALAGFAGVLAAPIYSVNPALGANFIIVVFAVVVIGGMGSIMGSVVAGFALGVLEGLSKLFYPEAASTVIFVMMIIVLLARPAGLFGKAT